MTNAQSADAARMRAGLVAAATAYLLWGFLPVYFKALHGVDPLLVLAHRVAWSAPTALLLLAAAGKLRALIEAFANLRMLATLAASSVAIAVNWTVYIWAVSNNHVLEGSLGYFINPLVSLVFAAALFRERFTRLQMLAIGAAALGVANQAVAVGQFPWTALTLATTFGLYGVIRKRATVDGAVGFAVEVLLLAPLALGWLIATPHPGGPWGAVAGADPFWRAVMLVAAGPITAAPLILFAFGARRLRLSTLAVLQYIGPSIQFALAVLVFGEAFTPGHMVTFGLIWIGVAIFLFGAQLERRSAKA